MKALAIGSFYDHDLVEIEEFRSSKSFLDYDIVIIDFSYILNEYKASTNGTYRGKKCLDDNDSVKIMEDINRRKSEILELLKLGRTIIVFTPTSQICFVDSGKREYSGTGKNRHTTRIVQELDVLSILPIEFETVEALGKNIIFNGDEAFSIFWSENKKKLSYNAYFRQSVGNPLFYIKGTNKVVGSYIKIEKGNLIFIPTYHNEKEDENVENLFFQSLFKLVDELKNDTGDFQQPIWSKNYLLPEELGLRNDLVKLENREKDILSKISKQKKVILALEEYKIMFTGTGRALELATAKVLKELGFEVTEGLPGRDDLILKYNSKVAVVEVKGVTKSAAEKHAAQLEKWVSEYYTHYEKKAKGILIVNTFKDTPLNDRVEDDFPPQMITYSKNREHCLITGIQLLSIYLTLKNSTEKKDEIIEEIFNTNGIYTKYLDWDSVITNSIEKDEKLK